MTHTPAPTSPREEKFSANAAWTDENAGSQKTVDGSESHAGMISTRAR
jgi:hypothetical protein